MRHEGDAARAPNSPTRSDDPYVYFKSPPFADFTIINQPEVCMCACMCWDSTRCVNEHKENVAHKVCVCMRVCV